MKKKRIWISELLALYPIKKMYVLAGEAGLIFIGTLTIRAGLHDERIHVESGYSVMVFFSILALAFFLPAVRYLKTFYLCVFPRRCNWKTRRMLFKSIRNETFSRIEELRGYKRAYRMISVSENWFCICNNYIPRNAIVTMQFVVNKMYYLRGLLITGEKFFYMIRDPGKGWKILDRVIQERTEGIGLWGSRSKYALLERSIAKEIKKTLQNMDKDAVSKCLINENQLQKMQVQQFLDLEDTLPQNTLIDYENRWSPTDQRQQKRAQKIKHRSNRSNHR